ncbi:hypothetical protein UA08_00773 [Talaromyces atroroseus]|uniref:FAD dependent oxidoreductase domain-containing protein n=1 Tax=Talaromyces atroroseus TaxID=1441469 RepID=A0A225BA75_TALAT|nr:hypothetical protein UA08_00773 [Talaromyces atroroseus]OKL63835.1 hypothetical protein UA08_00773 [Talaromyces atroroseus]
MPKVTVVGAGIVGLTAASLLPKTCDVTVVARNLPGDELTHEWASPWAGAVFLGLDGSSPREQEMQINSFAFWWQIAKTHPESSVRDETPLEKVWYRGLMPEFRVMEPHELPKGSKLGMSYKTVVITPGVFLPWLRQRLEKSGVKFIRKTLTSLADLKNSGYDILINATALGARHLADVADKHMVQVRGQTVLARTGYNKIFMRHGKDYTYVIPRLDGTAILGGIKQYGQADPELDDNITKDILRRVHENLPEYFPDPKPSGFDVIQYNVGIRPDRPRGVRVEKEVKDGEKIVHAYGTGGGGYVFSWGVAKEVSKLVDDFLFSGVMSKL